MAYFRLEEHEAAAGEVGRVILAIAAAGRAIAGILARGALVPDLSAERGESHGDVQKELDLRAHDIVVHALRDAPVRWLASEERDAPLELDRSASLAVAVDPLDGSSNIETNAPMGTIFSILAAEPDGLASFLRPGREQLAAGFLIYGSHTALVLTAGEGTHVFVLDPQTGQYVQSGEPVRIALAATEYAINGSNERHWDPAIRRFAGNADRGGTGRSGAISTQDGSRLWLPRRIGSLAGAASICIRRMPGRATRRAACG